MVMMSTSLAADEVRRLAEGGGYVAATDILCSSRFPLLRGVTFHQRRWKAQLVFGKHVCHIGLFSSEADAAKAFDSEVVKIWGKSAESIINFSILDYSKEVAEAEARLRKLAGRKKPPAAKKHVAHSKSVGRKRPTRFETKTTTTRRSK
eukprot:CAMPEP_0117648372 /NCGR_PEP_ID=MMETSP0804-20121206/364_1 /TAXON_ID=1074897 /ORGANISM="Tetraselmis astigmatica, Strain CCMP880" /LENGTH=148 /DNA_ID=CAMNT_0005453959 /DNA_START=200 /DNA_END=647 /DNA_ORIENTATION=-